MDPSKYKAAAEGNIDEFKNDPEHLYLLLTPNKNTILHIHITAQRPEKKSTLHNFCLKAKKDVGKESTSFMKEILKMCPSLLQQANANDEIPLHLAARYGFSNIVDVLVKSAETPQKDDREKGNEEARQMLRMTNKEGDTALHEAVRFKHPDVVKLLTTKDPDLSNFANVVGKTPLYLAAERGFVELVIEILRTCTSPAHDGPNGRTTLHAAVIGKNREILWKILELKEPGLTKRADQQGWTPLHYVALLGYSSMVEVLLKDDTSTAYVADRDDNMTALHIAAGHGNLGVVNTLISCCPDCCELVDKRGWNFLHFAAESGHIWVVNEVLKKNNFLSHLLNEKDDNGNTPLHLLANHRGLSTLDYSSASDFIKHVRVDKMALNKKNQSPLDIISDNATLGEKWKKHLFKELLDAGAKSDHITYKDVYKRRERTEEDYLNEIKKAKETHIIVAALIATVAFAASFTMPGGYISDKGSEQGTAVLARRAAFRAFVISNNIAMMLSSSAVFIYIFLAFSFRDEHRFKTYFNLAAYLNIFATGAMVVAFMTGQYAVLQHSSGLAISTCVTASSFFFFYYRLFLKPYGEDALIPFLLGRPIKAFRNLFEKASPRFQILLGVTLGPFYVLLVAIDLANSAADNLFEAVIDNIRTWFRNAYSEA